MHFPFVTDSCSGQLILQWWLPLRDTCVSCGENKISGAACGVPVVVNVAECHWWSCHIDFGFCFVDVIDSHSDRLVVSGCHKLVVIDLHCQFQIKGLYGKIMVIHGHQDEHNMDCHCH